jgi:hypothetical protein
VLYLLDANVLITASTTYYPLDQVPEFWSWIDHQGTVANIKLPSEILDEVLVGTKNGDPLVDWLNDHKECLVLDEAVDPVRVQYVLATGYGPNLTDVELEAIGRDPFLIAYALAGKDRCVVTVEVSAPGKKRQNRKVPDVCNDCGVACMNPFVAYRTLGFSTAWKAQVP